ncbi:MAG: SocA family protein [Nocardioidaceae bacterium]|nr:SocA family protein [Nocardioidaceae bacterium]
MTHTARDIANWFLAWADELEGDDAGLTNLKLQKLLYYAQGHYLARSGTALFADPIEAWAHGPVVKSEYHRLKLYGNGAIDVDNAIPEDFDWDTFRDVEDHLIRVWNSYGKYAAWALREKTHREAPWLDAFIAGERNIVIPQDALRTYFEGVEAGT